MSTNAIKVSTLGLLVMQEAVENNLSISRDKELLIKQNYFITCNRNLNCRLLN